MSDQSSLQVTDLNYAYPDGTPALRGVSLSVQPGDTLGLLGPNGAGKSTLLLHLNGILTGEGVVQIDDLVVSPANLTEIRSRVGLVFQDPDDQLFMPTLGEEVGFGPRNGGCDEAEVARRTAAALDTVGMGGLDSRPPHHLSVGQKKRVALATVLALDCSVLVLDEPTAGLDPRGRRQIITLLTELPQTKIIATHDMDLAWELCDTAALMNEGQVAAHGTARELLVQAELLEAHGLELPWQARLALST